MRFEEKKVIQRDGKKHNFVFPGLNYAQKTNFCSHYFLENACQPPEPNFRKKCLSFQALFVLSE